MNGIDLLTNLIDDLTRARNYIYDVNDELADEIDADLDIYYQYMDSFDAVLEDIEIEEEEVL